MKKPETSSSNEQSIAREKEKRSSVVRHYSTTELIGNNPPTTVYNEAIHNSIANNFNPHEFQPIIVVRVRVDSKQGPEEKLLIKDGMNRAYATHTLLMRGKSFQIPEDLEESHLPTSKFESVPVIDATSGQFSAYQLEVQATDEEGQPVLTMEQYWQLLVEPTLKHAEIAHERVAAIVESGWQDIIGERLAAKFSHIAALRFLTKVRFMSDAEFEAYFKNRIDILGETEEDADQIHEALYAIHKLAVGLRTDIEKVAETSFERLISQINTPGFTQKTFNIINATLHQPRFETKLRQQYPETFLRENARAKLATQMVQGINALKDPKVQRETLRALLVIIDQGTYSIEHVERIANSPDPLAEKEEVIRENNLTQSQMALQAEIRKRNESQVTKLQMQLMSLIIPEDTMLSSRDLTEYARAAYTFANRFQKISETLRVGRKEIPKVASVGITSEEQVEVIESLERSLEDILSFKGRSAIDGRLKILERRIGEIRRKWDMRINAHRRNELRETLSEMIGKKYSGDLPNGITGEMFANYLLKVGDRSEKLFTVEELTDLAEKLRPFIVHNRPDLLHSIFNFSIRVDIALQRLQASIHREQLAEFISTSSSDRGHSEENIQRPPTVPIAPPTSSRNIKEEEQNYAKELDEDTVYVSNEALEEALKRCLETIDTIVLTTEQLTPENRLLASVLANNLGELLTGRIGLDVMKILDEHFQAVKRKNEEVTKRVIDDSNEIDFADKN